MMLRFFLWLSDIESQCVKDSSGKPAAQRGLAADSLAAGNALII